MLIAQIMNSLKCPPLELFSANHSSTDTEDAKDNVYVVQNQL